MTNASNALDGSRDCFSQGSGGGATTTAFDVLRFA
jgi:hypothetical protein